MGVKRIIQKSVAYRGDPEAEKPIEAEKKEEPVQEEKKVEPKPLETKDEKAQRAKEQWADETKRKRILFGIKYWTYAGRPKRGSEAWKLVYDEAQRMLKDESWVNWVPQPKEEKQV